MKRSGFWRILTIAAIVGTTFTLQSCKYCEDFGSCVGCIWTLVWGGNCDTTIVVNDIEYGDEDGDLGEISCSGAGGGLTKVTVNAGSNITPPIQYCFLKYGNPVNWCSEPQAFGPGTNVLEFSNVPAVAEDCELLACITSDYQVASNCQADLVTQLSKTYVAAYIAEEWRDTWIEYDCMTGYDIRGIIDSENRSDLEKKVQDKWAGTYVCPALQFDETSITAHIYQSQQDLRDFIEDHWWSKFRLNILNPEFYLNGCVIAIGKVSYQPATVIGYTFNLEGFDLGKRGGASIIYVQNIRDMIDASDVEKAYVWDVAHELGHLIAGLHDWDVCGSCHNGENCLMNDLIHDNGNVNESRHMKFCKTCKASIAIHDWTLR